MNKALQELINRLSRSRFFTISVALHLLFVLTFGTVKLVQQIPPRSDFEDASGGLVASAPAAPEDQIQPLQATAESTAANPAQTTGVSLSAISVNSAIPASFTLQTAPTTAVPTLGKNFAVDAGTAAVATPKIGNIPEAVVKGINQTVRS